MWPRCRLVAQSEKKRVGDGGGDGGSQVEKLVRVTGGWWEGWRFGRSWEWGFAWGTSIKHGVEVCPQLCVGLVVHKRVLGQTSLNGTQDCQKHFAWIGLKLSPVVFIRTMGTDFWRTELTAHSLLAAHLLTHFQWQDSWTVTLDFSNCCWSFDCSSHLWLKHTFYFVSDFLISWMWNLWLYREDIS